MPLSCSIWEYDSDSASWYFYPPKDYTVFVRARRKRCSCGDLISFGETCTVFKCARGPRTELEERIRGEEVWLASKYLCERCSDMYFSLLELGFVAVCPEENMIELVKEYSATYKSTSL